MSREVEGNTFQKFRELEVETDILHFSGQEFIANLNLLRETTAEIFEDGFGMPMSPGRKLSEDDDLLVIFEEGSPVGYKTQLVFEHGVEKFVYFAAAIRKNFQGRGLMGKLLRCSVRIYQPTVVASRSQNPAAIYTAYRNLVKVGEVYPFDKRYDSNQRASQALQVVIQRVASNGIIDPVTGVQQGAYPEGKLGDYLANEQHPGASFIRQQLMDFGLNPINGDAVFMLCLLGPKGRAVV